MSKEHEKSTFNKDVEAVFREITEKHVVQSQDRAIIILAVDMSDETQSGATVAMSGDEPALAFAVAKLLNTPGAKHFVELGKFFADMQERRKDAIHNAAKNN